MRISDWSSDVCSSDLTPLVGLEEGRELHRIITQDLRRLDDRAAQADVLAAGRALQAACPDLGAVVLECANLPPYRAALAAALGLPVNDLVTLVGGIGRASGRESVGESV